MITFILFLFSCLGTVINDILTLRIMFDATAGGTRLRDSERGVKLLTDTIRKDKSPSSSDPQSISQSVKRYIELAHM